MPFNIFISAGEASGEHYGALLIEALKRQLAATGDEQTAAQTVRFFGMGGERMVEAGLDRIVRSEDMAVMGITEVIRHLPRIYGEFHKLRLAIREQKPDVAVLIDFPDIHFKLAEELHRLNIPVIFFVSPQLWAWKKHRIKLVRRYVRRMLVIFPFEEPFYRQRGVEAEFVGHPLADLPLPSITREDFAIANHLDPAKTWIGLLPGSRAKEIRDNLPEMLNAARSLASGAQSAAFEFIIPLAPTLSTAQRDEARQLVATHGADLPIQFVEEARATLFHARASVVASGTATVEAALIGNPFVVVYRVSPITYAIAKLVVKVPHIAMANLIAEKRVVPELIQNNFTAANIVQESTRLLPDGVDRESMKNELARVRDLLSTRPARHGVESSGAIERVAAITLFQLGVTSPARSVETVQF